MDSNFIKSDINNLILKPERISRPENLGFYKLLGIFKGNEFKKYCILCKGKTRELKAESPRYIRKIEKIEPITKKSKGSCFIELSSGLFKYSCNNNIYLPIYIDLKNDNSEITIIIRFVTYFCVQVKGKVSLNDHNLTDGLYKFKFSIFERNAPYDEWIGHKSLFKCYAQDSTKTLINIFDNITNEN